MLSSLGKNSVVSSQSQYYHHYPNLGNDHQADHSGLWWHFRACTSLRLNLWRSLMLSMGTGNRNHRRCYSHSTAGFWFLSHSCGQSTSVLFSDLLNEEGKLFSNIVWCHKDSWSWPQSRRIQSFKSILCELYELNSHFIFLLLVKGGQKIYTTPTIQSLLFFSHENQVLIEHGVSISRWFPPFSQRTIHFSLQPNHFFFWNSQFIVKCLQSSRCSIMACCIRINK